jgi:hypothetical protein
MAPISEAEVSELIRKGPFRVLPAGKQITLALGDLYFASTTLAAKAQLIWETEKSYPKHYLPTESQHADVQAVLDGKATGSKISVNTIQTVSTGNQNNNAVIEQATVGTKTMSWVRFLEGPLKGLIRFELNEFGMMHKSLWSADQSLST